ncbi:MULTISPECIES: hypothetical protein [Flavobacterium]|uniref:hypothetical protein n=1 Tax=Flavobacterium TaxID=237 RepID=UPI00211585F8|nr:MULTISPECIES: hypothetical protein [Flavobacterium]UUF14141.1 hypothetical protein NLJ00_23080 [Flavobacterium panici]
MNDTIGRLRIPFNELVAHKNSFIYIIEKSNDFNYWTLIPYIVSAISIGIIIYDRTLRPKIFGKILSCSRAQKRKFSYKGYDNSDKILNGQGFMLKISLGVYKKDLSFSDVNIFVNYKNNEKLKGEIYWVKDEIIKLKGGEYKMVIPQDQFLTYNNFIEKNKVLFFYLKFIVPNKEDNEMIENIEIEFLQPNKKTEVVTLSFIDEKQAFFDEQIHFKQELV